MREDTATSASVTRIRDSVRQLGCRLRHRTRHTTSARFTVSPYGWLWRRGLSDQGHKHHTPVLLYAYRHTCYSVMTVTTTEATPLTQVTSAVSSLWTHERTLQARSVAAARATDLRTSFETGHFSLRLLALVGGVALAGSAVWGLVTHLLTFHVTNLLLQVYTLALAALILVLESRQLSLPEPWLSKVVKYALFLKFIWGRGLLYVVAGSLHTATAETVSIFSFHTLVGLYLTLLGLVFIVLGYRTAQKLAAAGQRSINNLALQRHFRAADVDHSGQLTAAQFADLCARLELEPTLSPRETEICFLYLDTEDRGTLSMADVAAWFDRDVDEESRGTIL
jgi:hypothetical protein